MLPLKDNIPSRTLPVVTVSIIVINAVVFAFQLSLSPEELRRFVFIFGVVPRQYSDREWAQEMGFADDDYLPFFTAMFVHGGLIHILLNMWILWIFGDNVEDRMGHVRFVFFYLLTGILGSVAHIIAYPSSQLPVVGASGAIAGVMGAYFLLYPKARILTLIPILFIPIFLRLRAVLFLGVWFAGQVLSGILAEVRGDVAAIAWWAHVGGFVTGALLLFIFIHPKRKRA